jgi:diguanylate cyclase
MPNLAAPLAHLPPLDAAEITALLAVGAHRNFGAGELIFARGDPGGAMFVLIEGSIRIELEFREPLVLARPWDYFGELSLLTPGHQRSATARALGPSTASALDQQAVNLLGASHPQALIKLLRRTCAYIIDSEERLIVRLLEQNQALHNSCEHLRRTREALDAQAVLARTDPLTRLYNRRCLLDWIVRHLAESPASRQPSALVMIDLDGFKALNDRCGHVVGDEALCRIAAVVRAATGDKDLPCRYGGDELAILLDSAETPALTERLERLRADIAAMPAVHADAPTLTASLGASISRDADTPEDLIRRADECLYAAKRRGGDRWVAEEPTRTHDLDRDATPRAPDPDERHGVAA